MATLAAAGELGEKLGAARAGRLAQLAKSRNVDVGRYGSVVTSPKGTPRAARLGPGAYTPPAHSDPGGAIPGPESRVGRATRAAGSGAASAASAAGKGISAVSAPGGASGIASKLILALGAALIVLEVGSQLSGQYFHYDLAAVGAIPKKTRTTWELYKGQAADLAAMHPADVTPAPLPGALVATPPAAASALTHPAMPASSWA